MSQPQMIDTPAGKRPLMNANKQPADECCCASTSVCWHRWESTYDCETSSWGSVTHAEKKCVASGASDPSPTSWAAKSGSSCVFEIWIEDTDHNCTTDPPGSECPVPTAPSPPTSGEPSGCCEQGDPDCADCGGTCDDSLSSVLAKVPDLEDCTGNTNSGEDVTLSKSIASCGQGGLIYYGSGSGFVIYDIIFDDTESCYSLLCFVNNDVIWKGCKGGSSPTGTYAYNSEDCSPAQNSNVSTITVS